MAVERYSRCPPEAMEVETSNTDAFVRVRIGWFGTRDQEFRKFALDKQQVQAIVAQLAQWLVTVDRIQGEVADGLGQEWEVLDGIRRERC